MRARQKYQTRFYLNNQINQDMDKYQVIQSLLETMLGMVLGTTLLCLIYSASQCMTYAKNTIRIAGTEYVRETTRWAGHTHVVNIPVYKG